MALVYTDALARVRLLLMDASSAIWVDADLQGAIRLALGEASLYAKAVLTLNGLDSAVTTTLPSVLESGLIVGAAGYAAAARGEDRAEAYELASESARSVSWATEQLAAWRGMLALNYPGTSPESSAQMDLLNARIAADVAAAALIVAREDTAKTAELARLALLRASTNPFGSWTDDFGEKGG